MTLGSFSLTFATLLLLILLLFHSFGTRERRIDRARILAIYAPKVPWQLRLVPIIGAASLAVLAWVFAEAHQTPGWPDLIGAIVLLVVLIFMSAQHGHLVVTPQGVHAFFRFAPWRESPARAGNQWVGRSFFVPWEGTQGVAYDGVSIRLYPRPRSFWNPLGVHLPCYAWALPKDAPERFRSWWESFGPRHAKPSP